MSPLAEAIYDLLKVRVPGPRPEISYTDLVFALKPPWNSLSPDSDILWAALGEIVSACRAKGLPALPAIVVRHFDRVPGHGYYRVAHPADVGDPVKAMAVWAREASLVRQTTYPPRL